MTQESQQVDVVVVGLGPGGEAAATQLAKAGLDVVGVDRRLVGGECPYYGCIPSKMVIRAADAIQEGRRVPDFGGTSTVDPDWAPVHARIRDEATTDWDDKIAVDRLEAAGVTFVRGPARLTGPRQVDRQQHDLHRVEGRRAQHRHRALRAADRRARGHAVLDQPRRPRPRGAARVAGSSSVAARSGSSWRRRSPASGCG